MKLGDALKDQFEAVRKRLEEAPKPVMGVVVPAPGNGKRKVDVTPLAVAIDEGQLVGELLEWLHKEGFIQPANQLEVRRYSSLIQLQCRFFEERDR